MIMQGLEDLKVFYLLLEPSRWKEEFIHQILSPIEAPIVCGQLLSRSQENDFPIGHHLSSGLYTVKSCYDMLLSLNGLPSVGFFEAWKRFWKFPLPPKVLDFVWRLCSNCLPLRVRLHQKGVVLYTCCGLCDMEVENAYHLFFNFSFARSCWAVARLNFSAALGEVFHTSILSLLSLQENLVLCKFFSVLWAIWGQRNNRVSGRQALPSEVAVRTAFEFCNEWKLARVNHQGRSVGTSAGLVYWVRPPVGRLKLNIDAAMLKDPTSVGVGMVLRDSDGLLVACKSVVLLFCCSVKEAEAVGLREGLQRLLELHHFEVDVELDAKIVVDAFHSKPLAIDKFGCIIGDCRGLVANSYFSIQFVKRQANKSAHCLARVVRSNASPFILFSIPSILEDTLLADLPVS